MDSPRRHPMLAWTLLGILGMFTLLGLWAYGVQFRNGLGVTGLSRETPWGLYIAQFTFLVGIGASAVTIILPYYVHRQKVFAHALILGEIVAVIALTQALLCILVDLGQPTRLLNIFLYPSPTSMMFWDCITLSMYLVLSVVGLAVAWSSKGRAAPKWARILAIATIPWAIGIHVVTALLYAGLAARPAWMSAVLAPRFLATAFASGPALLILLSTVLARAKVFDIGREAIARLSIVMTYAATASVVLALLEAFTALYSGIPEASEHLTYLFLGLEGHRGLLLWSYASWILMVLALVVLLVPRLRRQQGLAYGATFAVLASVLIDKGLCLVSSGFVPSPLGYVNDYQPSLVELGIVAGIYAAGALVFAGACRWLLVSYAKAHELQLPSSIDPTIHALHSPPSTAREPGMAKAAQLET
jgi:Ni/Fe-hydrogenase subunit HybB-like protein